MHGDPSFSKGFGKTGEQPAPALIGQSVSDSRQIRTAVPKETNNNPSLQVRSACSLCDARRDRESCWCAQVPPSRFNRRLQWFRVSRRRNRTARARWKFFPPRPKSADPPVTPVRAPRNYRRQNRAPPRDLQPTNHYQSRCPPSWAGRTI